MVLSALSYPIEPSVRSVVAFPCAPKGCPGERLSRTGGRGVKLALNGDQLPGVSKQFCELPAVVSGDWKPGAVLGPVRGKRRDHRDAASRGRRVEASQVGIARNWRREEVQDRAIMPDPPCAMRLPCQHVSDQPPDSAGQLTETILGDAHRFGGDVKDSHVLEAASNQFIDETTRATADVHDRIGRSYTGCVKHPQRLSRSRLKPAAGRLAKSIRLVPVLGHRRCLGHAPHHLSEPNS